MVIAGFVLAPAIWMTLSVLHEVKFECKVCMSFDGKKNCGKAASNERETCIHTAKDNACALIASGMASSIQCSQKEPDLVDVK